MKQFGNNQQGRASMGLVCIILLAAPMARSEPDLAAAGDEAEAVTPRPWEVQSRVGARLRAEYEYRKQDGFSDNDLYGRLHAYGYDLGKGRLDVYASMRLYHDLDEPETFSLGDDPFLQLDDFKVDGADGVTEDRVLQLYADLHDEAKRWSLRAGRQYVDIADYLQMDGIQAGYNEKGRLGGRVYGGHPVSYYTGVSGDYAGGVSLVGRPWEGHQARLTFAQYHDESEDDTDRHYFLDLRQRLGDFNRARLQLSILNDEYRMARADYFHQSVDGKTDFAGGASYWGSFDAVTRVYSPLYRVLGEQDPYAHAYVRVTHELVDRWFVSPGVSQRFAEEGDNPYNNRDYGKYDLTLLYEPSRAFNASLGLEYWTVEDDDSFLGLSGEVRYRHGKTWEVSGGASFAEYTYDTYSDISYTASGGRTVLSENGTVIEESPFVRTYFLRGRWRVTRQLILRVQGDVEDNDQVEELAYRFRGSVEVRY